MESNEFGQLKERLVFLLLVFLKFLYRLYSLKLIFILSCSCTYSSILKIWLLKVNFLVLVFNCVKSSNIIMQRFLKCVKSSNIIVYMNIAIQPQLCSCFTFCIVVGRILLFVKLQQSKADVVFFIQLLAGIQQLSVSAGMSPGILITAHINGYTCQNDKIITDLLYFKISCVRFNTKKYHIYQ
jgi:hypothetical protein